MVATTGAQLLPEAAVKTMRDSLLPLTSILTPNIPEAKLLLRDAGKEFGEIHNLDDLIALAKAVQGLGPEYVLIKGGHIPLTEDRVVACTEAESRIVVNVLYGHGQTEIIQTEYIKSRNTHGTGCSLACAYHVSLLWLFLANANSLAAIASNLAHGLGMVEAVFSATRYIEAGIKSAPDLGKGNGPINHFHSSYMLPFAP